MSTARLENEVTGLVSDWAAWEVSTRQHVADEICSNAIADAAKRPAELMQQYPRSSYADALAAFEADTRKRFDRELAVTGVTLQARTADLIHAVEEAMAKAATVASERDVHGTSTSAGLQAAILEELQLSRLTREVFPRMTLAEVAAWYEELSDERDRTAVRLVEAAVLRGDVAGLGVRTTAEDAVAILHLRKRVEARRTARIPPALTDLKNRLLSARTRQRLDVLSHLDGGRGIASRPQYPTAVA